MAGDPTARVLQLLSLLQTHRFWPGAELAERLEVSSRTLRRDVDRIRALGYEVDATPGVAGGYRLAAGRHLPPLLLDDEEAVAIAVGLRSAAEASVEGIEETAVRAMAKLEQVLPDRLRRRVAAVHGTVSHLRWGGDDPRVHAEVLAVLAQACRDGEQVRFEYRRRDGESSRRLVEPHRLVSAGRRWYLVAWDVRRADWRTFRIDRASEARLAGACFEPRPVPGGDPAAFVAASIGSMPLPHEATLHVAGSPEEVRDALRWTGCAVEAVDEGTALVTLRSEWPEWIDTMVSAVASSFPVHTVQPAEVRERIAALAGRLALAGSPAGPQPRVVPSGGSRAASNTATTSGP